MHVTHNKIFREFFFYSCVDFKWKGSCNCLCGHVPSRVVSLHPSSLLETDSCVTFTYTPILETPSNFLAPASVSRDFPQCLSTFDDFFREGMLLTIYPSSPCRYSPSAKSGAFPPEEGAINTV